MRPAGPFDYLAVDAALARYRSTSGPVEPAAFEAWSAAFWGRLGGDPAPAYVDGDRVALLEGTPEHRIVLDADPALWAPLAAALRADPRVRALSLPEAAPPLPGFKRVERWEHRFDLRFGPADPGPPPPGYAVEAWDDGSRAEAAALLASVNSTTVDGVFLTWPDRPSAQRCEALLADFAAGSHGPFSPETSFLARHGERLAALTLVSLPAPEEALLFEIAVRFRHRGTGLAPYLLDRLKATLRPRGFRYVRFLACGANAAVLSLFRPEEVLSERLDAGWIWLRD